MSTPFEEVTRVEMQLIAEFQRFADEMNTLLPEVQAEAATHPIVMELLREAEERVGVLSMELAAFYELLNSIQPI